MAVPCMLQAPSMNLTITSSVNASETYQLWQFEDSIKRCAPCEDPTYLRPDVAGSLLPWLYTVFMIILHLPTVLIRVVRWRRVQILSLCLATVNVAITIQAFASTKLEPAKVLVWIPLTIPLDAGAMLQLMILLIEHLEGLELMKKAVRSSVEEIWRRIALVWASRGGGGCSQDEGEGMPLQQNQPDGGVPVERAAPEEDRGRIAQVWASRGGGRSTQDEGEGMPLQQNQPDGGVPGTPFTVESAAPEEDRGNAISPTEGYIIITAFILFILLVTLQIIALVFASKGRAVEDNLTVTWCSPTFQLFGLAVLSGDGTLYPIVTETKKGLGCIQLDARWQKDWLSASVPLIALSLTFEVVDLLFLLLVQSDFKFNGVKMRRPWTTMFFGLGLLIVMMLYAVFWSTTFPVDGLGQVWVFRHDTSTETLGACTSKLFPAGLRGEILAWTDGLLNNWNKTYYGY